MKIPSLLCILVHLSTLPENGAWLMAPSTKMAPFTRPTRSDSTGVRSFTRLNVDVDIGGNLEEAQADEVFDESDDADAKVYLKDVPVYDEETLSKMTLEEEIEVQTQAEMKKNKIVTNLRNANGVDYAPWMQISAEDEAKIKQLMKEKAEARRKRDKEAQEVQGTLFVDSQAQELSGAGLRFKIINEDDVELEWSTGGEQNTKGYVVKRRLQRTEDWSEIASYKTFGALASQGDGIYRYLDETPEAGNDYVYRITEVGTSGENNDLCQALVEIETKGQKLQGLVAGVGFALIAIGGIFAGITLDPMQ